DAAHRDAAEEGPDERRVVVAHDEVDLRGHDLPGLRTLPPRRPGEDLLGHRARLHENHQPDYERRRKLPSLESIAQSLACFEQPKAPGPRCSLHLARDNPPG